MQIKILLSSYLGEVVGCSPVIISFRALYVSCLTVRRHYDWLGVAPMKIIVAHERKHQNVLVIIQIMITFTPISQSHEYFYSCFMVQGAESTFGS